MSRLIGPEVSLLGSPQSQRSPLEVGGQVPSGGALPSDLWFCGMELWRVGKGTFDAAGCEQVVQELCWRDQML